ARADAPYNLFVGGPGVGRQQNLRALEPASRVLAAAQHRIQLLAFGLVQFDPITYIHPCLLVSRRGRTSESDGGRESFEKILHAQAGPVSGVYPPLYPTEPSVSGRNRHAAIFSRQPTVGSPDGADPRTGRS